MKNIHNIFQKLTSLFRAHLFLTLLMSVPLVLTSCEFFNKDVKAYFVKYTETAAIEISKFIGSYDTDDSETKCFTYLNEQSIKCFLRNPQEYNLEFNYIFKDEAATAAAEAFVSKNPGMTPFVITPGEKCTDLEFSFNKKFLEDNDGGTDLSGDITIREPVSQRNFDSYHIAAHDNSTPPEIASAALNLTSPDGGDYILCFLMPVISGTVHEKDTHKIIINSKGVDHVWYFSPDGTSFYSDPEMTVKDSDSFKTSWDGLYAFGSQPLFENVIPAYQTVKCFFKTGVPFSTNTDNFTITIKDEAGLKSQLAISNKASKLSPVTLNVKSYSESHDIYAVDDITNTKTVEFIHDLKTDEGNSVDSVTIVYKVYLSDGTLFKSGSMEKTASSSATIELESHNGYVIEASAKKNYYVTSELLSVSDIRISRSANYFVAQNGSDTLNDGTKKRPFKSIRKCIDEIVYNQIYNFGTNESGYKIVLLTDLECTSQDEFDDGNNLFVIPQDGVIRPETRFKLTICGDNEMRTVNLNGNSSSHRKFAYVNVNDNSEYIFENIKVTGGYTTDGASVIYCLNADYENNELILRNVEFSNNYIDNRVDGGFGAAVSFDSVGKLCVDGKVIVKDNFRITKDDSTGEEKNIQSNVFLRTYMGRQFVVNVLGPLTGSWIGITTARFPTEANPEPVTFTKDYGYYNGFNNGIMPGRYFKGDLYKVSLTNDGEACVTLGSGEVDVPEKLYEDVSFDISSDKVVLNNPAKNKLTIVPKVKKDEAIEYEEIPLSEISDVIIRLLDSATVIPIENTDINLAAPLTLDFSNFKVADNEDNLKQYQLYVKFKYNGEYYEHTFDIEVYKVFNGGLLGTATNGQYQGQIVHETWMDNDGNVKISNNIIYNSSEVVVVPTGTCAVIEMPDDSSWNSYVINNYSVYKGAFIKDRKVKLDPFVIGQYEVNQALYSTVNGSPNSHFTLPTDGINWYGAIIFCNNLTKSVMSDADCVYYSDEELTQPYTTNDFSSGRTVYIAYSSQSHKWTKKGYRLPTEAEWEFAARGGNPNSKEWCYSYAGVQTDKLPSKFYSEPYDSKLDDYGWYNGNSGSGSGFMSHEVGQKESNSLGLYDMSGNLWEWCYDYFNSSVTKDDYLYKDDDGYAVNPLGASTGTGDIRCLRGGAFNANASFSSVSYRHNVTSTSSAGNIYGFRICRSIAVE